MPEILCVKAQDVPQPLIRQHTSACVSIQAQDVPQSVIYGNTVFKALSVKARLIHLNCFEDQDVPQPLIRQHTSASRRTPDRYSRQCSFKKIGEKNECLLLASGEEMYHIEFVIACHDHLRQRALLLGRLDVCKLCANVSSAN